MVSKDYSLKVKVEPEYFSRKSKKYNLMTSHNGHQWSGGALLTLKELEKVRDEIDNFLSKEKLDNE